MTQVVHFQPPFVSSCDASPVSKQGYCQMDAWPPSENGLLLLQMQEPLTIKAFTFFVFRGSQQLSHTVGSSLRFSKISTGQMFSNHTQGVILQNSNSTHLNCILHVNMAFISMYKFKKTLFPRESSCCWTTSSFFPPISATLADT